MWRSDRSGTRRKSGCSPLIAETFGACRLVASDQTRILTPRPSAADPRNRSHVRGSCLRPPGLCLRTHAATDRRFGAAPPPDDGGLAKARRKPYVLQALRLVEPAGIEPATSCLQRNAECSSEDVDGRSPVLIGNHVARAARRRRSDRPTVLPPGSPRWSALPGAPGGGPRFRSGSKTNMRRTPLRSR